MWRVSRDGMNLSSRSLTHSPSASFARWHLMLKALSLQKEKKKCGRFLLLDTKTGGEVNTQSFTRPCAFSLDWKLSGFMVEGKKTLICPSRREKRNLKHSVWVKAFFIRPKCLHMATISFTFVFCYIYNNNNKITEIELKFRQIK